MRVAPKPPRPKKCKNPECALEFIPFSTTQKVCHWKCGLAIKEVNEAKARKAIADLGRREIRAARERIKTRGDHTKEAQAAFNEWVRLRDAALPCISCGRHHQGKYDAGHYRTVGSNPALRFEPLNCHKQCVPCNQHKSGDIVNYRINLLQRIGAEMVAWIEGPHEPRRYTIEELKAIKAKYRALTRELKGAQA
ncbi:recombination protein NinG [Pseudomonas vancouverensis]|uniref:Recombination protein NinG n=1 Tax=Pseudomonas vancouverensis TaxID=95300 RepID=A0A1H2MUG1_PSEVA|nr:recombination protein NinG [Pseudomonas vancouverensis]KAB0489708.1 recombination protein NinG [Pseudomonas vancouverensis]TDB67204.1 recombination protein NinG [Pseudomonas vancouverensis]SDU96869.1 Bacteriophage Lambda NinG protein [Pseudomonas vancouverensis]